MSDMSENQPKTNTSGEHVKTDHAELARAIERLLPITIHNTPDYAEVSFGECQAQAMTMEPDTWLALNGLPSLLAEIAALRGERDAAVKSMLTVQNAAKTLTSLHGSELKHLRENATFDHRLRSEHDSLMERDAIMTEMVEQLEDRATQAERQRDEAVDDERARGQAIINERDKWIVELIRERDEAKAILSDAVSEAVPDAMIFAGHPDAQRYSKALDGLRNWTARARTFLASMEPKT